jgi:serine protease AprX
MGYDPVADKGSLYNIAGIVGAHAAYSAGITGKGVGVALIDTGVAPVPGLTSGNVIEGPDLSFDSQQPDFAHLDAFGHGTHLASIIAGRDAAGTPSSYTDPTRFTGIAPDAKLVDVKVGASDGAVDVSQVIAGIDWVVQHKGDNGMNIRVINLSYGVNSTQPTSVDPLAYAVENAWKNGIVVVVSGGNDGDTTQTLANPARDPYVLAVGALDTAGTATTTDDTVPSWSTRGTADRHVDVVAPGASILGLRVPNGYEDERNPQARVGDRFARASGTSQAAAVVSGEVALLLQANPKLTPDQVKGLVTASAAGVRASEMMSGSGSTDLREALRHPVPTTPQSATPSTGTGSLEASRGDSHVSNGTTELTGEVDIFGTAWDGAAWARSSKDRKAWKDGSWRGAVMTGKGWKDGAWPSAAWTGTDWDARTWRSADWEARTWRDGSWTARTWRDAAWDARTWRDAAWSARTWRAADWSSSSWD